MDCKGDRKVLGWHVCDLHGKYSFSNDVIFNEHLSG